MLHRRKNAETPHPFFVAATSFRPDWDSVSVQVPVKWTLLPFFVSVRAPFRTDAKSSRSAHFIEGCTLARSASRDPAGKAYGYREGLTDSAPKHPRNRTGDIP